MLRALLFSLVTLGLIGCVRLGGLDDLEQREQRWQIRQETLATVNLWDLYARAAVSLPGEAYNIGLQWQRKPDHFLLSIDAPFGQGVIQIEKLTAESYRLQLPDGRIFTNNTPEALLDDVIGWAIPISGLEYWIRGMPREGSTFKHRIENDGRAREISQDDWFIVYLDFFEAGENAALPRRLRLTHKTVTIKLAIERWQKADIDDQGDDLFPAFN